jgi:hypothetical protein
MKYEIETAETHLDAQEHLLEAILNKAKDNL